MSTVKVNTVDKRTGSTLTLGGCGTTVTLGAGATQSGFGRTGTVDWCTTAKTAPFTGVSGKGYFVNTACGAVTVTLPVSPSANDIISIKDYAGTFATNNLTICNNGSKIGGVCNTTSLNTNSQSVTLIYVDATKGWQDIQDSTSNISGTPSFIVATGGTITCCGDYKIHTFTSDGTFTICTAPTPANNNVDYLVVAGGGGGGSSRSGAGGAGGFRESYNPATSGTYTASPLATPTSLPVSVTSYPITVGGGGNGAPINCVPSSPGSNSIFSSITSTAGGGGASNSPHPGAGSPGGSGGGAVDTIGGGSGPAGSGNTPPVSPSQGNSGGTGAFGAPYYGAGGGGGATSAGGNGTTTVGGAGGNGAGTQINNIAPIGAPGPSPTSRYFAGGGGGGGNTGTSGSPGYGGGGIGGEATTTVGNGVTNTGGGAGGGTGSPNPCYNPSTAGGNGGSGIVIIRYKYQ
jgi:hypothetical protein